MKRARMSYQVSQKRPIDKSLIVINKSAVDSTQVSTDLVTATFPCTITGLRWNLTPISASAAGDAIVQWAIILVKDGNSANTMASSDGSTLYEPEQNVLSWGMSALSETDEAGHQNYTFEGDTKTMRKLMGGDKLVLIVRGATGTTFDFSGCVQFFCKS